MHLRVQISNCKSRLAQSIDSHVLTKFQIFFSKYAKSLPPNVILQVLLLAIFLHFANFAKLILVLANKSVLNVHLYPT